MICLLLGHRFLIEYIFPVMIVQFRYRLSTQRNLHQVQCPRGAVTKTKSEFSNEVNCNIYEIEHIQVDILIQRQPLAFRDIPCNGTEEIQRLCKIIFGFRLNPCKQAQIGNAECSKIHLQGDLDAQFDLRVHGSLNLIGQHD